MTAICAQRPVANLIAKRGTCTRCSRRLRDALCPIQSKDSVVARARRGGGRPDMCAENLCVAGLRGFSYAPEGPLTASQRVTTGRPPRYRPAPRATGRGLARTG